MSLSPTAFFIIDGHKIEMQAHFLIASILDHMQGACRFIAYIRPGTLLPESLKYLTARAEIEIREIPGLTPDPWKTPYPIGNKLLAAADDRGDGIAAFLDTDVVFCRPVNFIKELGDAVVGAVLSDFRSACTDDSTGWYPLFKFMQVEMPTIRTGTLRRPKLDYPPYFNAGMVIFHEKIATDPRRIGQEWLRLSLAMDHGYDLPAGRENIDQITLSGLGGRFGAPTAMLPQRLNYNIMGWGEPPEGTCDIAHYHVLGRLWRSPSIGGGALASLQQYLGDKAFDQFTSTYREHLFIRKALKMQAALTQ